VDDDGLNAARGLVFALKWSFVFYAVLGIVLWLALG
jgi:hypothetical protein